MGIFDGLSDYTSGFGSSIGNSITILVVFFLIAVVGGVIFYFILNMIKFKYRVTIMENVDGKNYVPVGQDRARLIAISDAGEEVLYLKKRKKYKGAYGRKTGKNHYTFAIGSDGYWHNITFGDLNTSLLELKIVPVDKDMRYAHEGIRKNVAMRFDRRNWLKENIGTIFGVLSIILVLIFMWLLADKYFTIFGAAEGTLKSVTDGVNSILDRQGDILVAIDNICSGGSGMRPV